jgi:predicted DNA binding CopG/RHH family protein
MKKFRIIILLTAIILQGFSQNAAAEIQNEKKQQNNDGNTKVNIGRNALSIEENDSSVNVRIGSKGLRILESLEGDKFRFEKFTDENWDQDDSEDNLTRKRNRGIWIQ